MSPEKSNSTHAESSAPKGAEVISAHEEQPLTGHVERDSPSKYRLPAHEIRREFHAGPLPAPRTLEQYESLYPGATKLIFEEFSSNGKHIRNAEMAELEGRISRDKRGQWMAFLSVLVMAFLAAYLAVNGREWVATVLAGATLVGVAHAFLTGKKASTTAEQKSEQEPE
ncbi:DUF2335 domain-containing protein [Laribacter hongkongensis]|nr:DUF2335 domain-containing protein [Laribacter hongkongensis]MCG9076214.1 DUF2335 domain-containing protein [Laribacter hongkongensis]